MCSAVDTRKVLVVQFACFTCTKVQILTLWTLESGNVDLKVRIAAAGGIHAVLAAMTAHTASLHVQVLSLLALRVQKYEY